MTGVRPPFIQGSFLRLNMPSADSRCEVGSPYGLLTRGFCFCRDHLFVLPDLMIGLVRVTARDFPDAKGFFYRFPLYSGGFQLQLTTRRNGSPGVSIGYFQRTVVRYTGFGHMTDIGLYLVLQTRPGLTPPQICLPSTLSGTGHTCTSTCAFASGFLQACIAARPLPSATLRLRQAGDGLCQILVS